MSLLEKQTTHPELLDDRISATDIRLKIVLTLGASAQALYAETIASNLPLDYQAALQKLAASLPHPFKASPEPTGTYPIAPFIDYCLRNFAPSVELVEQGYRLNTSGQREYDELVANGFKPPTWPAH